MMMEGGYVSPVHTFLEPINSSLSNYGAKILIAIGVVVLIYLSIYIVTKITKRISSKNTSGFSGNVYNLEWYIEKLTLGDNKDED